MEFFYQDSNMSLVQYSFSERQNTGAKCVKIRLAAALLGTPGQLIANAKIYSANHMAASQCYQACGDGQGEVLNPSIRMISE